MLISMRSHARQSVGAARKAASFPMVWRPWLPKDYLVPMLCVGTYYPGRSASLGPKRRRASKSCVPTRCVGTRQFESSVHFPVHSSGGHGIRTRNPLRGTTFPVWLLTNSDTLRDFGFCNLSGLKRVCKGRPPLSPPDGVLGWLRTYLLLACKFRRRISLNLSN